MKYKLTVSLAIALLNISSYEVAAECCSNITFIETANLTPNIKALCNSIEDVQVFRLARLSLVDIYDIGDGKYILVHINLGCIGPVYFGSNLNLAESYDPLTEEWVGRIFGEEPMIYNQVTFSEFMMTLMLKKDDTDG